MFTTVRVVSLFIFFQRGRDSNLSDENQRLAGEVSRLKDEVARLETANLESQQKIRSQVGFSDAKQCCERFCWVNLIFKIPYPFNRGAREQQEVRLRHTRPV